ncbi:MAG: glycosyltransferase family 4 protein [Elusimicrobia bacterium]|nr:glycosyltransferase family 4 protein [Elusimicrobiota bacterium]
MTNEKKPKILVVGYLPPPQEGTAKITEVIINSDYLNNKYELKLLSLAKRKKTAERGKFSAINVIITIYNCIKYLYYVIRFNPQIIYMPLAQNKFGFLRDSIFILIDRIFGKKICLHFHGGSFDIFLANSSSIYKKYIKFVLSKVNIIILLANKLQYQFINIVPENSIKTLYNPSPLSKNIYENIPEKKKADNALNILFIGYISKAKGALDLARAVPLVKKGFKGNLTVNLCGHAVNVERNIKYINEPDGGYSKILEIIKENNLQEELKLLGQVDDEKKDKLFRNADIFVFPSYSEGCPIAVMEAMSYGLPLIVTPVGALDEMLKEGENCLFIKPGDYSAIAEKILYLINSPEKRKEMGKNNYELVRTKYNPEVFCIGLSKIWGEIV